MSMFSPARPDGSPGAPRPAARVLIVEDEALIALDIERRLERAGYTVVGVADNRDDALELFRTSAPDLVMMDIFIRPPADGVETARALASIGDVPVVFLTAYADDDTLRRAAETSPYGYLLKPFDERTLLATVTVALERHAADTHLRLLGSAVDAATVGIALVDVRRAPVAALACNDAALGLLGRAREDVLSGGIPLPPGDPEDAQRALLLAAIDEGRSGEAVLRGPGAAAEARWAAVSASPVTNRAGLLTHFVLFYRDITAERRTLAALDARERDYAALSALEAELRQQAAELAQSLDALQSTQQELVRREKLASLGVLVAGVAHEVNTPLGVAVTASSVARDSLAALQGLLADRPVRLGDLRAQVETVATAFGLVDTNLQRAAELVQHFKIVAVDQSSDGVRAFELGAYVREVVASLRPLLRRSPVEVRVVAAGEVRVRSRPGSLSQVVTNFVTNALTHAFDPGAAGEICVEVGRDGDDALLTVRDNGRGMSAEVAARVFDPFFTTRAGTGGSGLGLFIVHNLVVEGLGGTVALRSSPGEGTSFDVRFPCTASDAAPGVP
jgi:signal transduction histidine kinase/CheY-like chemotaxis protein